MRLRNLPRFASRLALPALLLWSCSTLASQPRLLVNAKLDTQSAAGGLEAAIRSLLGAQPQPAWIAYDAPLVKGAHLGCELVSPNGWWAPGVVHLEPPERMVVMFRVELNAVTRLLTLSPECEIDAGGLPFHWLAGAQPAQSVKLLGAMASADSPQNNRALDAISLHATPEAVEFLIARARAAGDLAARKRAVQLLSQSHDARAAGYIEQLLTK
jgi:hypothetical protein